MLKTKKIRTNKENERKIDGTHAKAHMRRFLFGFSFFSCSLLEIGEVATFEPLKMEPQKCYNNDNITDNKTTTMTMTTVDGYIFIL